MFKELLINDQITAKEVRLIDADGTQLGIVPLAQASAISDEKELDLVLLSPNAIPPVCKLMNYSKFRYEQIKKEKEERKNQKIVEIKNLRISIVAEKHDIDILARKAIEHLKNGNKVRLDMLLKGRQNNMVDRAFEVINNFAKQVEEFGTPEKMPEKIERKINLIISPKKQEAKKEK